MAGFETCFTDMPWEVLYTTLTVNSTTLFTLESPSLAQLGLFSLPERISSQMSRINSSSTPMGEIPMEIGSTTVTVMYVKEIVQDDIVTVVTAVDSNMSKVLPITTLQRLLQEWKLFKEDEHNRTIAFKVTFNHVIKHLENEFSRSGLRNTRDELERTRQVMEDNIERVVERNERIGLLVDKTDRLTELSNGFRGSATRVKRAMWWHNFKFWIAIVIVVILLLFICLKVI